MVRSWMMSRSSSAKAAGSRLREDLRMALAHLVFSTIGGAVWMPRIGRRLIYQAAGTSMQAGPGARFVFAGQPGNLPSDAAPT